VGRLGSAGRELLAQEFEFSTGHLAAVLSACVFAPSLLTFWFVNGVIDFSTAFVLGSLAGPGGLMVRLVAYLLLVPTYLLVRATYYLAHPVHRAAVVSGTCPRSDLLSLDWFSVGILATGLPLAVQNLGPWLGSNAVFLVTLFVLPAVLAEERRATAVKVGGLVAGTLVFAYANYGDSLTGLVPWLPTPAVVLGPVATLQLSDSTVDWLLAVTNGLLTGPPVVALVALAMNRLLTRPELTSIPYVRRTLPRRDPARTVAVSAALGTLFYLLVVAVFTGRLSLVPP
jgi:hypothetical protein